MLEWHVLLERRLPPEALACLGHAPLSYRTSSTIAAHTSFVTTSSVHSAHTHALPTLPRSTCAGSIGILQRALDHNPPACHTSTLQAREIYIGNLQGALDHNLVRELFNSVLAPFVADPMTHPPIIEVKMDGSGRFCFLETRTEQLAAHLLDLDKMEVGAGRWRWLCLAVAVPVFWG